LAINDNALASRAQAEIEELHRFFVGWFSGKLPKDCFQAQFMDRFDPECLLMPPGGKLLTLEQFSAGVHGAHATNPNFRIVIRNVVLRWVFGSTILATYEEWQRFAIASKPPENVRFASVLFNVAEDRLCWLHIHETWLPEAEYGEQVFDF
jgi:hypothetical protein